MYIINCFFHSTMVSCQELVFQDTAGTIHLLFLHHWSAFEKSECRFLERYQYLCQNAHQPWLEIACLSTESKAGGIESFSRSQTWLWKLTNRHNLHIKYWKSAGIQTLSSPNLNPAETRDIHISGCSMRMRRQLLCNDLNAIIECTEMYLSLMYALKPELNQDKTVSYCNLWSQGDS